MFDEGIMRTIGRLPFDGHVSGGTRLGSGPRRGYIFSVLQYYGLEPTEDEYGNIWVERGKEGKPSLYSSHMDVDATRGEHELIFVPEATPGGIVYRGILDNAVGCALNISAALAHYSEQRGMYVFTASEEEEPGNSDNWCRSARDVIKVLQRRGIQPELCVAVDVTYPGLLMTSEELSAMSDEEWDATPAERLFDQSDRTHVYVDSLSSGDARQIAERIVRARNDPRIKIRDLTGFDEAATYAEISAAFAVGPVGYGKYDEPDQKMPKVHVRTAADFLQFITQADIHGRI